MNIGTISSTISDTISPIASTIGNAGLWLGRNVYVLAKAGFDLAVASIPQAAAAAQTVWNFLQPSIGLAFTFLKSNLAIFAIATAVSSALVHKALDADERIEQYTLGALGLGCAALAGTILVRPDLLSAALI